MKIQIPDTGTEIWDPEKNHPESRGRKSPDPGSATLPLII
jgi:hypothetical protein